MRNVDRQSAIGRFGLDDPAVPAGWAPGWHDVGKFVLDLVRLAGDDGGLANDNASEPDFVSQAVWIRRLQPI